MATARKDNDEAAEKSEKPDTRTDWERAQDTAKAVSDERTKALKNKDK